MCRLKLRLAICNLNQIKRFGWTAGQHNVVKITVGKVGAHRFYAGCANRKITLAFLDLTRIYTNFFAGLLVVFCAKTLQKPAYSGVSFVFFTPG